MRDMQILSSKHRISAATAVCPEWEPGLGAPEDLVAAAVGAWNDMERIVSDQCFTHPESSTQDTITAYAQALMRLRGCASAAGFWRLTNACDALGVTVSRLIDDRSCACDKKYVALTRFVAHAETMIQIATVSNARRQTRPVQGIRNASDRVSIERHARPDVRT